ncbi:MFS transporter [Saccharicrinis sp. FJH54]|uniref:MFS transporter n=1 Tax=Saccharicrinis sp. FJH54 TaxID=3344665 RepID=UPI0035D48546
MQIPVKVSTHNFRAFIWHAAFLALAQSFMDVDTVIPAMLVEAGGNAFHIGLMTAILMGGSSLTQLFFAPFISNRPFKKSILLTGINLRVLALISLGMLLFYMSGKHSDMILYLIFALISLFALGGAFANIAYMDIIGKSINPEKRKKFFSIRQIIIGVAVLISAFTAKQIITAKAFPVNYAYTFLIGGLLLLTASGGFWRIREHVSSHMRISSITDFFRIMKTEIRENEKLVWFLGFINTQGIAISFLPFVVLYAKTMFNAGSTDTGVFLLNKIIGVVLVSVFVLLFSGKVKYRYMLMTNVFLSVLLASSVLIINDLIAIRYLFIIGGIIFSLYNISMNGVLLEVSGNENRALYAGFAGAGNILPAIFPLLGGWLIQKAGFATFFGLFIIIVLSALYFIRKMNCQK